MCASQTIVSVHLESMPTEVKPNTMIPEPLFYHSESRQLSYRGFMTRASYDYLRDLSRNNEYQRALLELYQLSSLSIYKPHRHNGQYLPWLALVAVLILSAVAVVWYLN